MLVKASILFFCLCLFQSALSSIQVTTFPSPPPPTYAPCNLDCQNNGSCVVYDFGAYCYCPPGYTGELCQTPQELCDGFVCHNGGICYNGTCVCSDPFYGPSCCEYPCNMTCLNNGTCRRNPQSNFNEYCECPYGYSGSYCQIPQEVCGRYICHNGGTCQDGICSCPPGYTGFDCRVECGIICENNGQCIYNNRYNVSYCNCEPGFTGERCEVEREICGTRSSYGYYGPVVDNFCYNGGSCINDSCVCEYPFSGPSCCSYNCSLTCQNGGRCQLGLYDNSEYCECPQGYSGLYCEQALETCGRYLCLNNGTCVNGTCYCPPPYTGADCAFRTCDLPCVNNGSCLAYSDHQFCVCPYPFFGEFCQFPQEVQVSFEQSVYEAVEGGTANVTVAVDGFFTVPFTVTVIPSNGTAIAPYDYDGSPVMLTFEPNSTVEIAGIYINADNVVEFMENFRVTLATPPATNELTVQLGTLYMAQVNIQNIDGPVLVSFGQNYTVTEGDTVYISLHTSIFHEIDFAVTVRFVLDKPRLGIAVADVDYEASTYVANFFPGQMYATVMVPTLEDNTTELSEYFRVELYSSDRPELVAFGSPNMTVITIEDNDPAVQVSFAQQSYTVTEGGAVNVTLVTSTSDYEFDFTVTLELSDGSATAGSDFTPGPLSVSFSAGQPYAILTVSPNDDDTAEPLEYFTLMITSVDRPDVVEIGSPNTSVITIVDNNAIQVRFAPQNYTVTEGGTVNITLEAVPPSDGYDFNFTVTLQYMNGLAIAGYDYTPGPYTVDFTAGQMYATLMVSTMDDNTTELSEYFSVMITSTDQPGAVIVPPSTAFITIEDNDPAIQLRFAPQNYTVTEGGSVNITLEAFPPSDSYDFGFTVTLQYMNASATAGYDYTPGPYTVDFTAGQLYATLMVSTMDDSTTELTEYFKVMIISTDQPSAVMIVSPSTAFIAIEDNDPAVQVQFDPQNYTVTEGDVVNITLVTNTSDYMFDFTVTLQIMDGTATAGSDYEAGPYTVTFTAGQLYATLMVSTMDDNTTELTEYFSVMIISTDQPGAVEIGPYDMALVTIEDNDPAVQVSFAQQSYTVTEGGAVNITLVTSTSDYEFDFTVTLEPSDGSATAGSDYTPGPYTVTFTAGQPSAILTVSPNDDDTAELSEYFTLMISSVDKPDVVEIGSPSTSVITIEDNNVVQLRFAPQNYTVTEGGSVNITLEAVPPSDGYDFNFTVTLQYVNGSATAGYDYTPGPYTVTFTAGQLYATLMVSIMDDNITELSEYFKVMIISTDQPSAVEIVSPSTAFITIEDNEPDLEVFFDPTSYTVSEDMNVTLVLRVSTSDFSFPFTVTVNTIDITAVAEVDYVPGGYTVSFQPGQNEVTLEVPTMDDNIVEMVEMYSAIIASTSVDRVLIGSSDMANITIQDNDVASCPQETLNRIIWPSTPVGQTANESCQCEQSQSNRAFRQCGPNGQWEEPDETLCGLSIIIENLCPAANVPEQIEALTNISMVENLDLTVGDVLLLTETVNEVIDGPPINNMTAQTLIAVLNEVVATFDEDQNNTGIGEMVLETLDRVAGATLVMDEMPLIQVEENVVMEVVVRGRAALQQNGLTTSGLRDGNRVMLPSTLFSFPGVPDTPRFTAVSINNRNLIRPRARNNRLRSNIISVNLNVPGGLRNLGTDQRIRLTFSRDTNTNDAANGATSCVFYDTQTNDWSTEGCEMVMQDAGTVTCACNHLTAFSILQSPADPTVSTQPIALVVTLSVVGGVVLLVLAATGVAYLIWRSRQKSQKDLRLGEI